MNGNLQDLTAIDFQKMCKVLGVSFRRIRKSLFGTLDTFEVNGQLHTLQSLRDAYHEGFLFSKEVQQ